MPNLKDIKNKTDSVKKTRKITTAMKLVAGAKVNKVQKKVLAARPFAAKVKEILANLQQSISPDQMEKYPLLSTRENIETVLLIVFSSDRGLCAAYNTNIIKAARKRIAELKAENKQVKLFTVGKKASSALDSSIIEKSFCNLPSMPRAEEASIIAEKAAKLYVNAAVDRVEIISTHFVSLINSEVENKQFLPVAIEELAVEEVTAKSNDPMVIFDPGSDALINTLLPMYIENIVFQALLESTASELAARMTAMSNATKNATEFINRLTLKYNKIRQAAITQEISEIVGGAAALA